MSLCFIIFGVHHSASFTKCRMFLYPMQYPSMGHLQGTLLEQALALMFRRMGHFGTCGCGEVSACKVVDTFFASVVSHGSSGSLIP